MKKIKQVFACSACGGIQSKWVGKCPDCGAWDSLIAERVETKVKTDPRRGIVASGGEHGTFGENGLAGNPARPIADVPLTGPSGSGSIGRLTSGIDEFDRVLGGGLVPGSALLVGGDPGIGKSTLLLQAASGLARSGVRVLYVSSEESAEQVKLRASRLGAGELDNLYLLSESSLTRVAEQVSRVLGERITQDAAPEDSTDAQPDASLPRGVIIIDSIQMMYSTQLDAFPGSLTQLRRCTQELVFLAKVSGHSVIMVGHVTKDGVLAGPRLLEHLVDCVLSFEGDRYHAHRLLRAIKNRFGSTLELGLFEMTGSGLSPAPAGALVSAVMGDGKPQPGSALCPVVTGSRTLMVEVQALTATGFPGAVKRKAAGIDASRLAMLIAVLEQHGGLRLSDRDVFTSAVGGIKITEPAADLAIALAIAGAHYKRALAERTCVMGEIGLGSELRGVHQLEGRLSEAANLGFKRAVVPAMNAELAKKFAKRLKMEIAGVKNFGEAMAELG